MTWNVWWRFGTDWRLRGDAIEATISACEPDLIGLQEAWATGGTDQAAEFAVRRGGPTADAVTMSSSLSSAPFEAVRLIDRRIDRIDRIDRRSMPRGTRIRARTARVLDEPVGDVCASDDFGLVVDADVEPAAVSA